MKKEDKEEYLRRYDELKKQGQSFYPYIIYKDAVVALLIFAILLGLVVFVGTPLEAPADPANTTYVPRPEWYFMFIFEMLKYFPGEMEPLAVVGVPGLAIIVLFLLPFVDRGPRRHPRNRPLAIAVTTVAIFFVGSLTYNAYITTPPPLPAAVAGAKLTWEERAGKRLYQEQKCAACHSIGGVGGQGGPDLAGIGSRRDLAWIHQYIEDPKALNPDAAMPGFLPSLSHDDVEVVAKYLMTLR